LSNKERQEILEVAKSSEYMDYSPWVIVAKLADKGKYIASESSFYNILNEHKMLRHRGKSKVKNSYRPAPLVAYNPKEIWTWDITYLKTSIRGQYFYLYLFLDIFSRKIVGFDIHEEEAMEYSSELVERICVNEGVKKDNLTLHSDNGGPMKGATMLATLERLGVAASFSRPRVSNDNPYSESLFKTLKYCPKYPEIFNNIAEAKHWVIKFINWYNNHPHSGIKFVTPEERHQGLDIEILERRKLVYLEAKKKNSERWGGRKIRNWDRIDKVFLNHLQKKNEIDIKNAS
jgi:putative transposase